MATVDIQNNPVVPMVGSRDADAVIITAEQGEPPGLVAYQIEKIVTGDVINVDSAMNGNAGGNIVSVNKQTLKIILTSRTDYRVRTRAWPAPWGAWVSFTTRDKRYQSPDAIYTLTDDTVLSAVTGGSQGGSRTITVTNGAKATEVENDPTTSNFKRNWGSTTVTNTDTIYNDGRLQATGRTIVVNGVSQNIETPVLATNRAATVHNIPAGANAKITYTNRGATIDATV